MTAYTRVGRSWKERDRDRQRSIEMDRGKKTTDRLLETKSVSRRKKNIA